MAHSRLSRGAQALVTHGLCSRIPNPRYLFSALTVGALLLYIQRPLALFVMVALISLQYYRTRQEEKILEAKRGEERRQYRARAWFYVCSARGCGRSRLMCCRSSSVSSHETARRTSQHLQTMREEIRERLGVRSGHAEVEKRGNDSHEQAVQDEA